MKPETYKKFIQLLAMKNEIKRKHRIQHADNTVCEIRRQMIDVKNGESVGPGDAPSRNVRCLHRHNALYLEVRNY